MNYRTNKDLTIVESQIRGFLKANEVKTDISEYRIFGTTPTGGKIEISADEGCAMAILENVSTFTCTDLLRAIDENEVTNVTLSSNGKHSMSGFINWRV